MRKLIVLLSELLFSLAVYGQQDVQFSQYLFNGLYINPAYAGYKEQWNVNIFYRQQWAGFPGAPKTFSAAVDGTVNNDKVGLGLLVMNDVLGAQKSTALYGTYAYRIPIDETGNQRLSLGLSGGFIQQRLNVAALDPAQQNDVLFTNARKTAFMPDIRVGVYYNSDRLFAGLSADNLISSHFQEADGLKNYVPLKPHLYLTAGGLVPLSDEVLLKPSFLIKEDFAGPVSMDVNAFVLLSQKLWLGASYRTAILHRDNIDKSLVKSGAVVGMVQFFVNEKLRFGYAYDQTVNSTGATSYTTHELSLGYIFPGHRARMLSPRYF